MNEEMRACVERGMALLDKKLPGWHGTICKEDLDMSESTSCILGQLYETFEQGVMEVFGFHWLDDLGFDTIVAHGFVTGIDYVELEDIWKALLAQREQMQMCPLCPEWDTQYPISTDFFGSPCQVNGVACCEVCYNTHALTHEGVLA